MPLLALQTVTDGTNGATYSYLANSPLVDNIVLKQNGTTRMTTTKQYDYLNRLQSISSAPAAAKRCRSMLRRVQDSNLES